VSKLYLAAGAIAVFIIAAASLMRPSPAPAVPVPAGSAMSAAARLTPGEYDRAAAEFIAILNRDGARAALAVLRARAETDDGLMRSCHPLAHELGRAAYARHGDFAEALAQKDEICNSGYMHGVIEAHFAGLGDAVAGLKTLCDAYEPGSYDAWECYHGAGHGVMYFTDNDLPASLLLCKRYASSFASETCMNGVFMENFATDQKDHLSKYLKPEDPFYPCGDMSGSAKSHCYLYAPTYYLSLHPDDYAGALAWCRGAETGFHDTCVMGVGSQAIKENMNRPATAEAACDAGDPDQREPCISGMAGLAVNHFGAAEPALEMCGALKPANRRVCEDTVAGTARLFR
jgi:hypothetical protein